MQVIALDKALEEALKSPLRLSADNLLPCLRSS
jgi:hypothetical protein